METFFDFEDGPCSTRDVDGHLLRDEAEARHEAIRALAEILLYEPSGSERRSISCSIRSEAGSLLYQAKVDLVGSWNSPRIAH